MAKTASRELALAFYAGSGFGAKLDGGPAYITAIDPSPNVTVQLLGEETVVAAGANPAATVVLEHG